MKKTLALILASILIFSFTGCNSAQNSDLKTNGFPTNIKTEINGCALYDGDYNNEKELYDGSIAVILGTVVSADEFLQKDNAIITYMNSKIKIEKVYKGDLNIGDEIDVLEDGKTTDNIDYTPNGVPFLNKGEKVLLFLHSGVDTFKKDSYWILNDDYGKYYINSENQILHSSKLNDNISTTATFASDVPTPFEDMDKLLDSFKNSK